MVKSSHHRVRIRSRVKTVTGAAHTLSRYAGTEFEHANWALSSISLLYNFGMASGSDDHPQLLQICSVLKRASRANYHGRSRSWVKLHLRVLLVCLASRDHS